MTTEQPEIQSDADPDREARIDEAFGEYLAGHDAGQPIDKAAFLAKYPDLADSLEKYLETESTVRKLAGPTFAEADDEPTPTIIGPAEDSAAWDTGTFAESVDTQTRQIPVTWGIPEKFGRYRVQKLLGQGAMGAVYLAQDTQLDRPVALKIPKFDQQEEAVLLERFYREARAVATIHHRHICPVFDVGEIHGQIFLSMAFIKGRPLADFTRSSERQGQRSVAKLVMKLAAALQEAHEIGVLHRDLKPANIMVSKKGEPVVMDFGLARQLDSREARVTQSGYIVGTPAYMSPEQVESDLDGVGPLSDQYSLGVVFYELLTGQLPFTGSVLSIIGKIAHKEPQSLEELRADLDPRLADICRTMMAKEPAQRFENMAAVAAALESFLNESKTEDAPGNQSLWNFGRSDADTVLLEREPQAAVSRPKFFSNRWVRLAAALGFLALLAGVVIFFRNADGTVKIEITDPKIQVTFADQTFTIDDNGKEIEVTPGQLNLHVERDGLALDTDKLTITRNGQLALKATWIDGELAVLGNGEKIESKKVFVGKNRRLTESWEHLFNGKDLTGWIAQGNRNTWRVENRILIGEGVGFLYSRDKFDDFHLRITAKVNESNSGVFFRTYLQNEYWPDGYEFQVTAREKSPSPTGLLLIKKSGSTMRKQQPSDIPDIKPNTWFTLEIIALGQFLSCRVNGRTTTEFVDNENTFQAGLLALQLSPPTNSLPRLQIKTIEIKRPEPKVFQQMGGNTTVSAPKLPNDDSEELARWMARYRPIAQKYGLEVHIDKWTPPGMVTLKSSSSMRYQVNAILPRLAEEKELLSGPALLDLNRCRLTEAGSRHLRKMTNLQSLGLHATAGTDIALAHVKEMPSLRWLDLGESATTDGGLVHLKELTNLEILWLAKTDITDAGLVHLKGLPNLKRLKLGGTKITDAGLQHVKDLTNLTELDLWKAKVSDTGLAHLKGLKNLTKLTLSTMNGTTISDTGLEHLRGLTNLEYLNLNNSQVTGAGLKHLKGMKNLEQLYLGNTEVTDAGLVHLKELTNLRNLYLVMTDITDAGLMHLQELENLKRLHLPNSQVTGAGLKSLKEFKNLESLVISPSQATPAETADLKRALPNLTIEYK